MNVRPSTITPIVLLAGLTLAACGGGEEAPAEEAAATDTRRIINVQTEVVQPRDFHDVIRLTGTVIADRSVRIAAEEGGMVVALLADKGDRVTAGQELVRLDADLLQAETQDARSQAKLAHELWERTRRLYEDDGIGTETAYLQARYTAESARARQALVEARLANTVVRAPFDGVLDERMVELGAVLAPGQAIGTLVDLDPLQISAGVPERYAADVALDAAADVHFTDLGQSGLARVTFVGARVHSGSRTFPLELSLEQPIQGAKPEMVADVVLSRRVLTDVIVVPRQALVRLEDGYAAFVVEGSADDAVARQRPVQLGASASDQVVVEQGLSAGDRLITLGQNQVADSDRVRMVTGR